MWTEIRTENVGVTHVGEMKVCWPIGTDVSEDQVRYVKESLREERVWNKNLEQLKAFGEQLEADLEFHKTLADHGVDLSVPTDQTW